MFQVKLRNIGLFIRQDDDEVPYKREFNCELIKFHFSLSGSLPCSIFYI